MHLVSIQVIYLTFGTDLQGLMFINMQYSLAPYKGALVHNYTLSEDTTVAMLRTRIHNKSGTKY